MPPTIVPRDRWGARPPNGSFRRILSPKGVVVHHSATTARSVATVASIQREHQGRGWVDIGYNFLISEDGQIYEGRPELDGSPVMGAHSPGKNSTHLGICVLGDFRVGRQHPTGEQVVALVELCQRCAFRYRIDPIEISGHRDHRATECPGDRLYALLGAVRALAGRPFVVEVKAER